MSPSVKLREIRMKALMTQRDLAHKAGVCVRTIYSVEAGHSCSLTTKKLVLQALGLTFLDQDKVWPDSKH